MSLASLLVTGKCLFGVREGNTPYRETHERYLPRFSLDASQNLAGAPAARLPVSGGPSAAPDTAAKPGPGDEPATPVAKPAEPVKAAGSADAPAKKATPAQKRRGWLARLARLFDRPESKRTPPLHPMTRMQVQGELSLDDVKPLRNDLTDSDIKVVPFRSSSAPHPEIGSLLMRQEETGGAARFFVRATGLFGKR